MNSLKLLLILQYLLINCFYSRTTYCNENHNPYRGIDNSPTFNQEKDGPLSLDTAIHLALRNNPDIQIALQKIRQTAASRQEANAVFFPILTFSTEYVHADAPSLSLFKSIDSRSLAPNTDFNDPGTFSNFESGITVRYNLYNGGRDALARTIAQYADEISNLDFYTLRNILIAEVIVTYYDLLMTAEMVQTAEASVKTVKAQLQETRTKWQEGNVLKSDVLSLEVRLAEARERLIRSTNKKELGIAALMNLIGVHSDASIELINHEWDSSKIPDDYHSALSEALQNRPELLRTRKMVKKSRFESTSAKRSFFPRMDTSARVYWDDSNLNYGEDRTNWFIGVTVAWDLFDGGIRSAKVNKAQAIFHEMMEADQKWTLAVQLDVKTAYLQYEEAEARLKVTEAGVRQAEETLKLVRKQYEGGTATVTRYLEAELALTQARMRQTNASFDVKKSLANAARAVGWFCQEYIEGVSHEN